MKISGKVYILITNTFIYEILIGLHNSLNPRLDSIASRDDNLPSMSAIPSKILALREARVL